MKKQFQKRYFVLAIVMIMVGVLVWRVSISYAYMNQGYEGNNIVSGDKWGVNIISIDEIEKVGEAVLTNDVSTIATTLNFDAILFQPGDKLSFNVTVENTGSLNAELYALTLSGLSDLDGEVIDYQIIPIDSSILHDNDKEGSILKKGEKQVFKVILEYSSSAKMKKEYHLNLASTIIYKQK